MRGGPRKGFGGAQPNSGRKPLEVPTKPVQVWLTVPQWLEFKSQGGSPWLQGILNLQILERQKAMTPANTPKPMWCPKGSMCMACAHKDRDCRHLDFQSMPAIERSRDRVTVKCSGFEKAGKINEGVRNG